MNPHLSPNDMPMFYKYLANATNYFEYGSGGSTYQASIHDNIQRIYAVESDKQWYNKMKALLCKTNKVTLLYNEMNTQPKTWGAPGPKCTTKQMISYSNYIRLYSKSNIDLILIDGRFRVACCLKCFDVIDNKCLIAFDDFLTRPHYHIVLDYYDIVEQTIDNRMVILKKKSTGISIPLSLIAKYELIKD
jgi:protein O-GlcNAc transferase